MEVRARFADFGHLSHAVRADCCSDVGPSVAHPESASVNSKNVSGVAIRINAEGAMRPSVPSPGRVRKRASYVESA